MSFPFALATRERIAALCQAFVPLPPISSEGLKRSGVAIAMVEADDPAETAFLLTKRVPTLRSHGGQWALPGGRTDPGETVVETALRELDEELGLRLDADSVLGQLDEYPTRSGYLITPVLVWAGADARIAKNDTEVARVDRVPLTDIMPADVISFKSIPESDRLLVRIHILRHEINAPTAALLYQFRELLAGRITRVVDYEQPVFAWR